MSDKVVTSEGQSGPAEWIPSTAAADTDQANRIARPAMVLASLGMMGLFLTMGWQLVIAALFGTSRELDAFWVALSLPKAVVDSFHLGILTLLFIIIFNLPEEGEGLSARWRLVSSFLNLVLLSTALLIPLMVLSAKPLVRWLAPGLDPSLLELSAVMLPGLAFLLIPTALAGAFAGILNAHQRFLPFALSRVVGILVQIFVLALLGTRLGIRALIWAMILGAIAMLVVTVGPLLRTGFRYTPAIDFRDDRARTVFTVFAALLIFALLDRLNQISNRYFASLVGDGAISALEFGWRFELPISHVLSSSVALPSLAMMALQAAGNQVQALRKTVTISLGLIAILVVPLIGFLVVLREPLTALWLQHGAFSAHDSALVSSLLPALSVSYLMRALGTVTVYGLLILRQLKALLGILVLEVIATTVLNAVMVDPWGLQGVVIATSIARVGANIWLGFILLRALGGWSLRSFGARVWKPLTVSFGSVLVLFAARSVLDIAQPTRGTLLLLIELAAIGAAYLLMHFGLCRASGLVEIRTVRGIPRPALSPSEWSS